MGFKVGDVVTSNGQDRPILTYVNEEQNYGEAKYSDGFSFRLRLSDYRLIENSKLCDVCGEPASVLKALRTAGTDSLLSARLCKQHEGRAKGAVVRQYSKYEPVNPCLKHKAFEADNCPGCGTADRVC